MAKGAAKRESKAISEAVPDTTALVRPGPVDELEVASLAYQYWLERNCPIGSPDEDWFRAQRELQEKRQS
jgi:hypothetical protein